MSNKEKEATEDLSPIEELKERKEYLKSKRGHFSIFYNSSLVGCFIVILMGGYFWLISGRLDPTSFLLLPYGLLFLAMAPILKSRLRQIEEDLQSLDFEIDLTQFEVSTRESRAEKILRINQSQLKRYYDLNLNQNIWVFSLGIFCILLGVGVIVATFYIITQISTGWEEKTIIAIVGAIGSILSNYVATIFLKIHNTAASSLDSFHGKLIETQSLFLGNLLASRIEDEEKRWETLSKLAISMSEKYSKEA